MSIFKAFKKIILFALPFLKSAARKTFDKLPKEKQLELINISKLAEIIKQVGEAKQTVTTDDLQRIIKDRTGLSPDQAETYIMAYWAQKGVQAKDFAEGAVKILQDASNRTETGLKSLWIGFTNIVSSVIAEIDWQALLLGVGEIVYRDYVKGKIKL